MTTKIDQKAYLQKYLSGSSKDKKKKKKKVHKGKGFKIIDDDIDLTKLRALEGDELDILDQGEDAPVIAGIIDERPEDVKRAELINSSSKWRVINQDDGFNSKLQIEEIKKDIKEQEKENEIVFGKMYSDSEDEKQIDSDASPPRKSTKTSNTHQEVETKTQNIINTDASPPKRRKDDKSPARKTKHESKSRNLDYDTSLSPSRRHGNRPREKARKQSRWGNFDEEKREAEKLEGKSADSDASPPRKSSKQTRQNKSNSQTDKTRRENSDSDVSPPRKSRKDSPNRSKRRKSPDSDLSPPRKRTDKQNYSENKRKQTARSSDSDLSPPRKHKQSTSRPRQNSRDSDLSPPRKSRRKSPEMRHKDQRSEKNDRYNQDNDRRDQRSEKNYRYNKDNDRGDQRSENNDRHNKDNDRRNNDSPPPTNKKMAKTLEGKMAGLQNAKELRHENEAFRRREAEVFNKMTDDVSGRNAQVVSRKSGKRETSEERRKQTEKAERQKELDDKYKKWSKGLKQIEAQEARHNEFIHESSKPLARHKDDKDLEHNLKQIERDGDPMLRYIRERKRETGELPPEKPTYKGQFPPNRFNIRPGYRWDGVDRSNGYEKKYFDTQSKKRAQQEEYYKWSSADM